MSFAPGHITIQRYLLLSAGIFIMAWGCKKDQISFAGPETITFQKPAHFPEPVYNFENNPLTREGFELGRKLFYEPLLSANGKVSCGSCHHQSAGFSDQGKAFSIGVDNRPGMRNSPALANLAWYPAFMADGGVNHIEVMPLAPITDTLEMHEDLAQVLQKLQQHPDYPALFEKAFGSDSITSKHFLYSLAQFMSMMVSANSKFDRFLQDKAILSPAEQRGYELFKINCAHCHTGALTSDFSYRNNGLDIYSEDAGRARITLKEEDHGKFKVPSLRNVALSTPYMHDGRFESLQEVINHYSEGIQATTNLDPSLAPMHFSEEEKADLVLFLTTLTDEEYTQHTELSDPSVLR